MIIKKIVVFMLLISSANFAFASPDLEAATNDVCKCLAEPNRKAAEVVELIRQAQRSGDTSKIMAVQGDMMSVISAASQCFEKLPEKYPEIDKSQKLKDQVMEMAEQKCPNPASKLAR